MDKNDTKRVSSWPPFESLNAALARVERDVTGYGFGMRGEPQANFEAFVRRPSVKLEAQRFGTAAHLAEAYGLSFAAGQFVLRLSEQLKERRLWQNPRADEAGRSLAVASTLIDAAIVLHMRCEPICGPAAMSIVRTALEASGRAALLTCAPSDICTRWKSGGEIKASKCINALKPHIAEQPGQRSDPGVVYKWLCGYTHLDRRTVETYMEDAPDLHEHCYAAIAYTSWVMAVVAEYVTGVADLAHWPTALPSPLPWQP